MLPKEHGAYGQISFPLIAALAVAGPSRAGLLIVVTMLAGFLAHEPALIVLGQRGPRARRELGRRARRWLMVSVFTAAAAAIGAFFSMHAAAWSLAVPFAPAALLATATVRGTEKSWYGETATAVACAGAAVPISLAGGLSLTVSAGVAIPFALLFVSSTLAVRVVILRVRGGGDLAATAVTRRAALGLAIASGLALAVASRMGIVPASTIAAAAPGLLTAAAIALRPPAPSRLRVLGWTLVAISVLTTVIVISAARA
jgi:hypothetical protein